MPVKNFKKTVHVQYFAILRENRGLSSESITTLAETPLELYQELKSKYDFHLSRDRMKVAINDEFRDWTVKLHSEDTVVFIPPVAGG